MGLWDELKEALTKTRNDVGKKAAKVAAEQAWERTKQRISAAGDGLLDGLEEDLDNASGAREGRKEVNPYSGEMDDIEARIKAAADRVEAREADKGEDDPEDKARAELERLKKELLGKA